MRIKKCLLWSTLVLLGLLILLSLSGCGEIGDFWNSFFNEGNINKHLAEKYNNQHFNYTGNWKHITSSIIDGQGTIINGRTYFYTDDNGQEFNVDVRYGDSIKDSYDSVCLTNKLSQEVMDKDKDINYIRWGIGKGSYSERISSYNTLFNDLAGDILVWYDLQGNDDTKHENAANAISEVVKNAHISTDKLIQYIVIDHTIDYDKGWHYKDPWGFFIMKNNNIVYKAWSPENRKLYSDMNNYVSYKYSDTFNELNNSGCIDWYDRTGNKIKDLTFKDKNDITFQVKSNENGQLSDNYIEKYWDSKVQETSDLFTELDNKLKGLNKQIQCSPQYSSSKGFFSATILNKEYKNLNGGYSSTPYIGNIQEFIYNHPEAFGNIINLYRDKDNHVGAPQVEDIDYVKEIQPIILELSAKYHYSLLVSWSSQDHINGTDEQLYLQGTYKGLHSNK